MNKNRKVSELGDYPLLQLLRANHIRSSLDSPLLLKTSVSGITHHEKFSLFFSIVNESSNAVVITNTDKDIIYVNRKFEEISGYTFEEVIGKNPRVLKSNKTPLGTYRDT